jgi:NADPH:quinone reductase-like Zn-dependent oxidoreductase
MEQKLMLCTIPTCGACELILQILGSCVRNGGKIILYGRLASNDLVLGVTELVRQVSIRFFMINDLGYDPARRKETVDAVFQLLRQKVFEPKVGLRFPFEDFKKAIIESQKPGRVGKVLLLNEIKT